MLQRRIIFDLSSAARWTGPPVGIIRAQRAFAAWLRERPIEKVFAVFDPRFMAFRRVRHEWSDPIIRGAASLDAWALPDPTGERRRRSAAVPAPIYAVLQTRRTLLRNLERLRLGAPGTRRAALADRMQRRLITARYAPAMLDADGSRRAFLPPDLALAELVALSANDVLVGAGFGWSHTNIEAVLAARSSSGFRLALLCYDIIPLLFPHFFKPRDVAAMRRYWTAAFPAADLVVVNAGAVAADVQRYCAEAGLERPRLAISPLGADPPAMSAAKNATLPAGLEDGRYVLFVSTIEPRKGHAMLLRVWTELLAAGIPQAHSFKLVFVGRRGWMTDELQRTMAEDRRLAGSLVRLEGLEDATLDLVYRRAAFCVYPSLYEGYGLPVVEAFARGKAVLASSGGALAEVAAGYSPTLDPEDEDAWFESLRSWIEDESARRPYEAAIARSFRAPTWETAAAQFFAATLAE